MLRKLTTIALCISSIASASESTEIPKDRLIESSKRYNLTYDHKGFSVDGHLVKKYDLDQSLQKVTSKSKLESLLESDKYKFEVGREGADYTLKRKGLLKGGGPISGAIAYWATKTLCYGTAVAATGAAVVTTGGLAGAATGALVAAGTGGASTAVTITGAAIAGAGLANEAAMLTVGVVQATGGMTAIGSTVAAVETASTTMGTIFTLIPWLP